MFKFGFFDTQTETVEEKTIPEKQWRVAEQIVPKSLELTKEQQKFNTCCHIYGNITIKSFSESDIINDLIEKEESSILHAEFDHSDLVTAEYEGGLKIWECTVDLVNYIHIQNINFENKRILDLGCGCGILGIYTILRGAVVDFQDYNKEVIENITIPNVILNCEKDNSQLNNCNYFSGDWNSLLEILPQTENKKYDYILTSETIYNPENYQKLLDIFSETLKPDGIVYLAAKSYYFGVGGSTRQFEKHLEKSGFFHSAVCWKFTDGVQREILKITKI